MSPQFIRAVFTILVVRAIFLSPAQGSEYGQSSRPGGSSLHRGEAIRPSRLRFTKPCPPSASSERFDCIDGGDGDGERNRPALSLWEIQPLADSFRSASVSRKLVGTPVPGFVRLRC